MAASVAGTMAAKLRDLIELAREEGNGRAVELLSEALREAERIKGEADAGWY